MATFRPFRAVRPLPKHAAAVASKPYDVLTSEEARAEAGENPLSFLHVGKPEIDLPANTNPYDASVYLKGKENLEKLISNRILRQDQNPSFYVYAQTIGEHVQHGIAGCVSVEEYRNNTIRKHELTRPDKEDDRTKHILATNAHTGPIFMTYHAEPGIDDVVDQIILGAPEYDFVASDGVRHELWTISNEEIIRSITDLFRLVDCLYIADGHHRAAAAARAAQKLAASNSRHSGTEEYNYFLAVLFPHNQPRILEYNRIVKDLNGKSMEEFLDEIREKFDVRRRTTPVIPTTRGEYGMYLEGNWYRVTATPRILNAKDLIERLDVSILQNHLLGPILGIDDPRMNKRVDFVGGIRGVKALQQRVDSGEMAVAFTLYPTSMQELIALSDAGKIMPPKSTWFEPKLRDGVVVHMLH
ncbi:MAG: DUF1015 domain-containing protein [Ignavibacteriae bacterium]|nr:DUF1015 domain-containing protein [Ignavibacteriota bacterium]